MGISEPRTVGDTTAHAKRAQATEQGETRGTGKHVPVCRGVMCALKEAGSQDF